MKEEIAVGFLTSKDPKDKRSWSGTHNKMYESLLKEFKKVHLLGPLKKKKNRTLDVILTILDKVHLKIYATKYNKNQNYISSLFYAFKINRKLKNVKIDVLFAPVASTEIALLKTAIPICYLSDTSFGQINNYHLSTSRKSLSDKEADLIEQKAISKSTTQVYSSNWAAEYVIKNYNPDKDRVFTINFGANIDSIPSKADLKKEFGGTIHLLFLGVDWQRKGGDIVVDVFSTLIERGYDIFLTICGCSPESIPQHSNIRIIPFLDKNKAENRNKLTKILQEAHILFVPTREDCTPIVFSEANAFGIPIITTDVGGVSSVVKNNVNGFALPFESTPLSYANQIQTLLENRQKLEALSLTSREKFEKELNWTTWAEKMRNVLLNTVAKKPVRF